MLNAVRSSDSPPVHSLPLSRTMMIAVLACVASPLVMAGCRSAAAGTTTQLASPQEIESARQQMNLIPPPSKSRYMAVHSLTSWENPYLTVQENIATLHVTIADANPASLGSGGMLRPAAARQQNVTIRTADLPEALSAVPTDCWPYGRVVAIEEAHDTPQSARPAVRRNIEATLKTLGDMGVVAYEWNEASSSR
jgi:hypothetical protein